MPVHHGSTSGRLGMFHERRVQGFVHRLWHWVTFTGCILYRFGLGNLASSQTCLIIERQDGEQGHYNHAYHGLPSHHHRERPFLFVLLSWLEGLWNLNHLLAGCHFCVQCDLWPDSELNCDQDLGHQFTLRVHSTFTNERSSGIRFSESGLN